MNDERFPRPDRNDESGAGSGSTEIERDLHALRSVTTQDQPSLDATVRAARRRAAREPGEGVAMFFSVLKQRPALATAATALVIAIGLLAVPISYERTTGYDLALSLDGTGIGQSQVMGIADTFKDAVGADGVMVDALMDDGQITYVLKAKASDRTAADAFAGELGTLGFGASVEATPIKQTISTNVYAYAYERVIEISVDGKSASELENEIRSKLAAAGVTANVSVTQSDDKHQEIKINAEREALGDDAHKDFPELVLTQDGKPMADGFGVNVMKKKDDAGNETMVVKVSDAGRRIQVEIPNSHSMSDVAIAREIESQLAAAGIRAKATVDGNQVWVEKLQD